MVPVGEARCAPGYPSPQPTPHPGRPTTSPGSPQEARVRVTIAEGWARGDSHGARGLEAGLVVAARTGALGFSF